MSALQRSGRCHESNDDHPVAVLQTPATTMNLAATKSYDDICIAAQGGAIGEAAVAKTVQPLASHVHRNSAFEESVTVVGLSRGPGPLAAHDSSPNNTTGDTCRSTN